jgi:hypothetical protein
MLHTTNTTRQTIINSSKKVAFAIAMVFMIGIGSSFAAPSDSFVAPRNFVTPADNVNGQVKASFRKDFQKAELISSEVGRQFTKLTFKMNDMVMFAFYTENGELLAVTRNIRTNQLPIQLLLQLKNNYGAFWVTDLFELTGEELSNYYITIEDADKKITLRSTDNSNWEVYEKTNKN